MISSPIINSVNNNTMNKHDIVDQESMFWKICTKPVPGRASQRKDVQCNSQQNPSSTSFQDNQGEMKSCVLEIEDNGFCNILDLREPTQVVYSSALKVINNTRSQTSSPQLSTNNDLSGQSKCAKNFASTAHVRTDPDAVHISHSSKTKSYDIKQNVTVGIESETTVGKVSKFRQLLESNLLNLTELQHLSWSGIPMKVRPMTWRLLAGYMPANVERRQTVVEQKRLDYWNLVSQYFDAERDETYEDTFRQIHIDIPRMSPLLALFKQKTVQEMFERILFIWAIRHPASGYVQGINDLVTPFFVVFLQDFLSEGRDLDTLEVNCLPKDHQAIIEADSYWCLSKFLDGIQDNYIFAQLGIQHKVHRLKELIRRIDSTLDEHLEHNGIDYLQFTFRWVNNLLTREIPLSCCIRLWDTYLAELDSLGDFQLYVCAAFLLHWRHELLMQRDFQGLMLMLQKLPTQNWTDANIGLLVAEAYGLKSTFSGAPNHLQRSDKR